MQSIPAFYFDRHALSKLASDHRDAFANAKPFSYVAFDDFLPMDVFDRLVEEFPGVGETDWTLWGPGAADHTNDRNVEKLGTSDETVFGPFTRHFVHELNSYNFIRFVEDLTGHHGLISDPSLFGCGLHSTGRGGRLMIHTDTDRYGMARGKAYQHFNLIVFLNAKWDDSYGGHLELWDRSATRCMKKISPSPNRCVIFETSARSPHGHPHPLTCPEGTRRNSIAVYYYSYDRPLTTDYDGIQSIRWIKTQPEDEETRLRRAKRVVSKFVPPIAWELRDALSKRFREE